MRHLRQVGAVLMMLVVGSSVAAAQRTGTTRQAGSARQAASTAKVWEFGVDAGLSYGFDDPNVLQIQIPASSFRAGVHVSPVLSIEPFFGLNYIDSDVTDGVSVWQLGVGALYHFSENRNQSQLYLRPSLLVIGASGGGASDSEAGLGLGVGMKWPKLGGRMGLRGEAGILAINDQVALNILFGVSVFTR